MLTVTGFIVVSLIGVFFGWMSRIIGLGRDFGLGRALLLGIEGALLGWLFAYASKMYIFGSGVFLFMAAFGAVGFLFIIRFAAGLFA